MPVMDHRGYESTLGFDIDPVRVGHWDRRLEWERRTCAGVLPTALAKRTWWSEMNSHRVLERGNEQFPVIPEFPTGQRDEPRCLPLFGLSMEVTRPFAKVGGSRKQLWSRRTQTITANEALSQLRLPPRLQPGTHET